MLFRASWVIVDFISYLYFIIKKCYLYQLYNFGFYYCYIIIM